MRESGGPGSFTGYVSVFELSEELIGDGAEVFSLIARQRPARRRVHRTASIRQGERAQAAMTKVKKRTCNRDAS